MITFYNSRYKPMVKEYSLIQALLALLFFGCTKPQCEKLPQAFSSYNDAIEIVKSSNFMFVESVDTRKSSWIRSASYFSCDSQVGYFIFKADREEYINSNVPIELWNGFKRADSFGNYYNNWIKGKFSIIINN